MLHSIRTYFGVLFSLLIACIVVGSAFVPGYILLLDLSWGPVITPTWSQDGFNNAYPLYTLLSLISYCIPSYAIEKLALFAIIFFACYLPYRFISATHSPVARICVGLFYALNPFVFARLLSGQWFHVLGYAFLPLVFSALCGFVSTPNKKNTAYLLGALMLVSLTSVHMLFIALIFCLLYGLGYCLYRIYKKKYVYAQELIAYSCVLIVSFFVLNSFWLIPAYLRPTPIEARFDSSFLTIFAPVAGESVDVMRNVAALSGFWAEGTAWRYTYDWPQDTQVFWGATCAILLLIVFGIWKSLYETRTFRQSLLLVGIFCVVYVLALGVAYTPFQTLNEWIYLHVPLMNGLRDSHKFASILALIYAYYIGVSITWLDMRYAHFLHKRFAQSARNVQALLHSLCALLYITLFAAYGYYMFNGLHAQLKPVTFNSDWMLAKSAIDSLPDTSKILAVPFHLYLSTPLTEGHIVANPIMKYFDTNRILVGRDINLGNVRDQEVDASYRDLDSLLRSLENRSKENVASELIARNIRAVLVLKQPKTPGGQEGVTYLTHFGGQTDDSPYSNPKTWKELLPIDTRFIDIGTTFRLYILE